MRDAPVAKEMGDLNKLKKEGWLKRIIC